MHSKRLYSFLSLVIVFIMLQILVSAQSTFVPGNLVVLNVNSATAVSLLEYTTNGALVQTINAPSTGSNAITISNTATSEGALSLSDGGAYLGFVGYRTGTSATLTDRVIARVDASGTINTSSAIPNAEGYGANNIRACVFNSTGTRYWAAGTGTGGGIRTNLFGATSGSVQVSTTITNARTVSIFNGQLYCTASSGTIQSPASVGSGLPTTSGNTISSLPGFPTASGPSPYASALSPGTIATGSVFYVADDRASALGGIQKWRYDATTGLWSLLYTLGTGVSNIGARGVAVNFSSFNATTGFGAIIYATSAEASSNRIIKIIDNGSSSTASTLATAPASNIFRGLAFSPVANTPPVVTSNSSTAIAGSFYTYTITATNFPTSYASGALPSGLSLNTSTGVISGVPATGGLYSISLFATNANGTGSGFLNLKICDITSSSTQTNVLCNGGTSGSASISVSGGTPTYSYAWSPGSGTGSTINGLSAGTYTVTITDANACTATQTLTITQPSVLNVFGTKNDVTCYGYCDGSVSAIANGGVSPYTYSWSVPGYTTSIINNVCAGTYTVTASDSNGCTATFSTTIFQPNPLVIGKTSLPLLCNGGTTQLTITGTGGTPPYGYAVSPYSYSLLPTFTVSAGLQYINLIDSKGCYIGDTALITEPPLLVPSVSFNPILCVGGSTNLIASAVGGTGIHSYKLNSGFFQISPNFNNVTAGVYTLTVKDANQCTNTLVVNVDDPIPLVCNVTATPFTCSNGSFISANAAGGTGSLVYALNGGSFSFASTFTVNVAATYTVTVKDGNNCTLTSTVAILAPSSLNITETHVDPLCNGGLGSVNIAASGGTPPYTGIGTFTQLAGTVSYVVTDDAGCSSSLNVTVNQPSPLIISATFTPSSFCYGTTITPNATGALTYTWSGGVTNSNPFVATTSTTYTVIGTDAGSCTGSTIVSLNVPPSLNTLSLASAGNTATLNLNTIVNASNTQLDGATSSYTDATCNPFASVTDLSGGSQAGSTLGTLHLDSLIHFYNTQPYIKRSFSFSSTTAANSIITLYLTQDDFNDYNAANTGFAMLPLTASNSDPNIANIRITKVLGSLGSGTASIITPLVNFNASKNYWEISFHDSVFGSYFIHGVNPSNAVLPVVFLDFYGEKKSGQHELNWMVTQQQNCKEYQLQYSTDAIHYSTLESFSCAENHLQSDRISYTATNLYPVNGHNYYRVLEVDIDEHTSTYSKSIDLIETNLENEQLFIYPNPVSNTAHVFFQSAINSDLHIKIVNAQGQVCKALLVNIQKGRNEIQIDMNDVAPGLYHAVFSQNNQSILTRNILKK